jgi:hypothetical protein
MSVKKQKRSRQAPRIRVWLFPWRRSFRRRWSILIAALVVLPTVALMMSLVRVRVFSSPPSLNRSADLILVSDTPQNRMWMENIYQKTPFPDAWREHDVESMADDLIREDAQDFFEDNPELRVVNVPLLRPVFESDAVLPNLPLPEVLTQAGNPHGGSMMQPRLQLFSELDAKLYPVEWPDYSAASHKPDGLRYMIQVDAEGRVVTCVAAAKESLARDMMIENWLRRVRFAESKQGLGWLACEIIWEPEHD